MFVEDKDKIFYAKTTIGKIIESIIGISSLIIAIPFLILFIIGQYSGKVCDFISDKIDIFIKFIFKNKE